MGKGQRYKRTFQGDIVRLTEPTKTMETALESISARVRGDQHCEFKWLMPHYSKENLITCFHELKRRKAVGVDKRSKDDYEENLERNVEALITKMKNLSYRPLPARQVLIPKADGGQRMLGVSAIEDKIVQLLTAKILGAIYEPIFVEGSIGYRPGKNCHQGVKAVTNFIFKQWDSTTVLEIDFANFFGSIDHSKLIALLKMKIKDATFLRYIVRALKSGILEVDGQYQDTETGTFQGSICSPILANIFAHYAIDVWFTEASRKSFIGSAEMIRYCDDAVFLFGNKRDGEHFAKELGDRVERFGLKLNTEKTQLIHLEKTKRMKGVKQPTFNFLGFTFFLGKSKAGRVIPKVCSEAKRIRKKVRDIKEWLKKSRHRLRLRNLWHRLRSRVRGHIQYFAVSHNLHAVQSFVHICTSLFFKWINRRSQKRSINWDKFKLFLEREPMPEIKTTFALFT
jgi:group II intron reverse transcriptase/maturase